MDRLTDDQLERAAILEAGGLSRQEAEARARQQHPATGQVRRCACRECVSAGRASVLG